MVLNSVNFAKLVNRKIIESLTVPVDDVKLVRSMQFIYLKNLHNEESCTM